MIRCSRNCCKRVVRQGLSFWHVAHFFPGQAFEGDEEGAGRSNPFQGSSAT